MANILRIGTRDSELAVWQATLVKDELARYNIATELVFLKSEGDTDLVTPLYAMNVQGVFTRALDAALLSNRIDIAVHSMKDVPVQLAQGIVQAAVLKRASYKDILVPRVTAGFAAEATPNRMVIATSSIRRKAQWLHRYPNTVVENLRGNINTRLKKVTESNWDGAIFAAAGVERINLRPSNSVELDWMLPAPAQGAIMVVCRTSDVDIRDACSILNHLHTEICVTEERNFLAALMGGCATPISALATIEEGYLSFKGNIFSPDGRHKLAIELKERLDESRHKQADAIGIVAAKQLLEKDENKIMKDIYAGK